MENLFAKRAAIVCALLAGLPALLALLVRPDGSVYLGSQYNVDDHMVYAAWMRQAMDGRLLFDNRFTIDAQPGITIQLYFFVLGLFAKVLTIAGAETVARMAFSAFFVFLAHRLVRRFTQNVFTTKLALTLTVLGGGLGFLVWRNFGQEIGPDGPPILTQMMLGRLPTDVWQPEGFVLPSMLTNSLFVASLCLTLYALNCFLDAKENWRPVLPGFVAVGLLMNIHSYDALLLLMIMVGFLVMQISRRTAEISWVLRCLVIGAGAVAPALYFLHVLRADAVFQARAATETFSPNFRQVLFGYLPLIVTGLFGLVRAPKGTRPPWRVFVGIGLVCAMLLSGYVAAASHAGGYWMGEGAWVGTIAFAIAAIVLLASDEPAWNVVVAWAIVGLVAPYFPALFQRKLMMGLAIPWSVLAALGLWRNFQNFERNPRNLATALLLVVAAGSSIRWTGREAMLARENVSNTTVHPVFVSENVSRIMKFLSGVSDKRTVVLAMPGIPKQSGFGEGEIKADSYDYPLVPDLNPILSGECGVYTFAGHWSETPNYDERRKLLSSKFFSPHAMPGDRQNVLRLTGADYVVAPVPSSVRPLNVADLTNLGEVVVDGPQFQLIRVRKP